MGSKEYKVVLFDKKTGEQKTVLDNWYEEISTDEDREGVWFWWEEGNGSCDGNRHIVMYKEDLEPHVCEGWHDGTNRIELVDIIFLDENHRRPINPSLDKE